jgi:hypothetical protein
MPAALPRSGLMITQARTAMAASMRCNRSCACDQTVAPATIGGASRPGLPAGIPPGVSKSRSSPHVVSRAIIGVATPLCPRISRSIDATSRAPSSDRSSIPLHGTRSAALSTAAASLPSSFPYASVNEITEWKGCDTYNCFDQLAAPGR